MSTLKKTETVFDVRSMALSGKPGEGPALSSLAVAMPPHTPVRFLRRPGASAARGGQAFALVGLAPEFETASLLPATASHDPADITPAGALSREAFGNLRDESIEAAAFSGTTLSADALSPLLAQAPGLSSSDASSSVRVTDMPPWSLVAGGLAFGAVLAGAGGGGSGGPVVQQVNWSASNFSASAASGVTVVVNASDAPEGGVLTLSGAGAATVESLKSGVTIDASALSGALTIRIADDGRATAITVITGTGTTTLFAGDFRDTISITADRLPDGGHLNLSGSANVNVTGLVADLDASALSAGLLTVSTSSTAPGVVPKSSGGARDVDIRLGVDEARITALYTGDTVKIDAEVLSDGNRLRSAGSGAFEIRNLSGDLFNTATGTVSVTLDNDKASDVALGSSIISLAGSTTVTVNNGSLDDNDSVVLMGTDRFVVTGLLASLDATNTTGTLAVTTADAGDNQIAIVTGSNAATVAGSGASDTVAIDASALLDGFKLTLSGASAFTVTGLSADVDATALKGALAVSTPMGGFSAVAIAIGVAGARVTASDGFDMVIIDAGAMSAGSTLHTAGPGSVQVTGMSGTLINTASGIPVSVELDNDAIAGAREISVSSSAQITVANGSLDHDDTIRLSGLGPFNVTGLRADLDGHLVLGEISVTTATAAVGDDHVIAVSSGSGATTIDARDVADRINVDAAALQDDMLLRLLGVSSVEVRNLMGDLARSTTGAVKAFFRAGSSTSAITSTLGNLEVAAEPASLTPGTDTVNLDLLGLADDVGIKASGAGNFSLAGLRADLDAASVTGKVALSLVDPSGSVGALKNQSVTTGSGDDLVRYGANTLDAASTSVSLTLGGGLNVVSVENGAALVNGAKVVALNASGQSQLRLADGARVTLSSLHLVNPNSWDASAQVSDPFDSITQAGVQAGTIETIAVSTAASVLRAGSALAPAAFVLDADIEKWEIGLIGGGNNLVALGAGGQSVSLGAGNDSLALNGVAATGILQGLETLDVRTGGSIAQAVINAGTVASGQLPGSIVGTKIDFADASASLGLSMVQHDAIRDNALLVATGADSGTQTLRLSGGGTVGTNLGGIEAYELSGTAGPSPISLMLDGASGPAVINDFTQSSTDLRSVTGGTGADAIRSSAIDTTRGLLSVDLSAGGSDYLFVQNSAIGNQTLSGLFAKAGFGGALVESSPGAGYANPTTFSATKAAWDALDKNDPSLSLGIRAETITGFTSGAGAGADKVVYLSGAADVTFQRYINFQAASGGSGWDYSQTPVSNSVIEIDAGFAASQSLALGSDPKALDKVAALLARMSSVKPFTDQGGDKYYVIVYADQTATSDAWLYAATATENDGFDFVDNVSAVPDTDTLELIAVFKRIGADGFAASNFV